MRIQKRLFKKRVNCIDQVNKIKKTGIVKEEKKNKYDLQVGDQILVQESSSEDSQSIIISIQESEEEKEV